MTLSYAQKGRGWELSWRFARFVYDQETQRLCQRSLADEEQETVSDEGKNWSGATAVCAPPYHSSDGFVTKIGDSSR